MKRLHQTRRALRCLCALLAALLLCGLFSLPAAAAGSSARQTVRVGFFPFAGYHMEDENGVKSGYGYDVLQRMLVYENWRYEYVGYGEGLSWDEAQEMLAEGKLDLLTSATVSEDRLEKFDYSDIPIGYSSTILTVRASDSRLDTGDYSGWDGLRVGVLPGNTRNQSFAAYAAEHGFRYTAVEYDIPDALQEALKQGDLDLIVTSNLLKMDGVRIVDQFDEKPFYVIVKKGDAALLAQVNDALQKVRESDPAFADALYADYYDPQSDGTVFFTKEERAYIDACKAQGKTFRALINPDRKPLSYRPEGQEEMQGLLTDICRCIFERTGLTFVFEPVENRDAYVAALKAGEADVVCDFTGSVGDTEAFGFIRTGSYYNSSTSQLVRRGYTGAGTTCALTKSSITNGKIANKKGVRYIYLDTMEQCRDAVKSGEVDFSYGYTRTVQDMVYADVTNSLACITVTDLSVDFCMGANLDADARLASILSKSVESISEKDISYLSEPYTYYDRTDISLISMLYDHPAAFIAVLALLLLVLFGLVLAWIGIRRHRAEQLANEELSAALAAAEKANQAKTAFLSRVSHDMRTPLNGILGLTTLLRQKNTDPETETDLAEMELSGQYLLNLINDTLDVSRIESGRLELHPTVCSGRALYDNTLRLASIGAQKKQVALNVHAEKLEFATLYVDVGRVEQIFMNMIGNAVKFTPAGGTVDLTIRRLSEENGVLTDEYLLKDTGIGISPEFLPHIFEAFAQEDASRTSAHQGTGLGLSITRRILEEMGGKISVESERGKGTCFTFTIPMPLATPEQIAEAKRSGAAATDDALLRGRRVLLCEDHPLNTKIATRLLEEKGMLVEHAENGRLGVDQFAASAPGWYQLVLMDIRMPVMDGLDAARAIRALDRPDAKTVPIIAMTANAFAEDVEQSRAAGMNAHLSKPVQTETLYATMETLLRGEPPPG